MAVIDAENMVLGRMSSEIAKRILLGEEISVVNAEKAVVSGKKQAIVEKLRTKINRSPKGNPRKGPKHSRMPDRIVKSAIANMLPKNRERGRAALKRLEVFIGTPKKLGGKEKEFQKIKQAENHLSKKSVKIEEISRLLGAKW